MGRKKNRKPLLSKLSLRLAIPAGFGSALIASAVLYFISEHAISELLIPFLIIALLSTFLIYLISIFLYSKRIKKLQSVLKNISRKKFEPFDLNKESDEDELDKLIERAKFASVTIEKEILRLNKIENYRKEFIGDISHELKTPIFAIQGFIETLLNGAVHDDEVNELFLKKAMRNVNRLTYLTKDLMEISRLETGELKSNLQEFYLRDMILDVVEGLQYKSQKENIGIKVSDIDKNLQVQADRNQIKQVLVNLIENAIKYNREDGHVQIGAYQHPDQKGKVIVYTKDTGIGIDRKDLPRVTERFFRVDKSRSREKGGTGLGLSIVKHIIEAHGEELMIESDKTGSTFSFTLSKVNHVIY